MKVFQMKQSRTTDGLLAELKRAFALVTDYSIVPLKFCFFIDGLDEYSRGPRRDGRILEASCIVSTYQVLSIKSSLDCFRRHFSRSVNASPSGLDLWRY